MPSSSSRVSEAIAGKPFGIEDCPPRIPRIREWRSPLPLGEIRGQQTRRSLPSIPLPRLKWGTK
ncbi:hypothetical protein JJD41_17110 [Oxynema sp. CENA135]|nr:hypothetical protein [Oxynema sp. CENA135]